MKRFILIIISSCVMFFASAQEEIHLNKVAEMNHEAETKPPIPEKPLLFDDSFPIERINLTDKSMFNQPLLPDYTKNLDIKKYLGESVEPTYSNYSTGFLFNPLFSSVQVFNQKIYKLNDHFSFGGNSFGAQSVFDQPKMNPAIQDMSTKGASMFIEYKVSDKFKVQTRVSISNHSTPWEP